MKAVSIFKRFKTKCKSQTQVILVTHTAVGTALMRATLKALGGVLPLQTTVVEIADTCEPNTVLVQLEGLIKKIPTSANVLVLTDLYGSTPSNIAARLCEKTRIRVIAGLNMPMLIKIMNYAKCGLSELSQKAVDGGRQGVLNCDELRYT